MRKSRKVKRLPRAVREENRYSSREDRLRTARQLKSPLRRLYEIPFRVAWSIGGRSIFREQQRPVSATYAVSKARHFVGRQTVQNKVQLAHAEQAFKRSTQVFPKNTRVCVKRKERREVILALGRGGSGVRRPRKRSLDSKVVCQ